MTAVVTSVPTVKVDGNAISNELQMALLELRVVRELNAVSSCELRFENLDFPESQFSLDTPIEILAGDDVTVFDGTVVSVTIDLVSTGDPDVVVECHDKSAKLGSYWVGAPLIDSKLEAVVSTLASQAGLTAEVDTTSPTLAYMLHPGTGLEALDEIVRRYGFAWWVHDGKLKVKKPFATKVVDLSTGGDLARLRVRSSTVDQASEVKVHGWDPAAKDKIVGSASSPDGNAMGDSTAASNVGSQRSGKGIDHPLAPRTVASTAEATLMAQGVMNRRAGSGIRGWGETTEVSPGLVPGDRVKLENVTSSWSGEYPVARVEHVFGRDRQFATRFDIGPGEPAGRRAGRQVHDGFDHLTIGVVTDTADPDGKYRVKVMLPYFEGSEEIVSNWARLVLPGAGADRGMLIMPEIDDEVVVGFEHGDLNRPFVLGGVWNGVDTPKFPHADVIASGKTQHRSMTSRKGHSWSFDDTDSTADSGFRVELSTGAYLLMCEDEVVLDSGDKPIHLRGASGGYITIDQQGNIEIKGNAIKIEADTTFDLKSGTNFTIKSGSDLKAEGSMSLGLKGGTTTKVEGGTMVEVKGIQVKVN